MGVIASKLDTRDVAYGENFAHWQARVAALKEAVAAVKLGGGERARKRHLDRGKLLPRDRIRSLVDPGSPFLELSQLAAHGVYDDNIASAPGEKLLLHIQP